MSDWRKSMIAKVKMAQKQLGISDDVYRDVLEERYGERSCTKLTLKQLDDFLRHLGSLGWKERTIRARKGDQAAPTEQAMSRKAMLSKIEALLAELGSKQGAHVPWSYAAAILKRMYRVDSLEWAKPEQLRGLIAALHNRVYGSTAEEIAASLLDARHGSAEHLDMLLTWAGQCGPRKLAMVKTHLIAGGAADLAQRLAS